MINNPSKGNGSSPSFLGEIADELLEKLKRGESVDIERYCLQYPGEAGEILDVFSTLTLLQQAPWGQDLEEIPRILGDFHIIREVGRGGMGVVYEAEQVSLQRRVALKVLPFAAMLDKQQLSRFKNEALAAASLRHPHIVSIYHFGCERGVYFYAMEFVEGKDIGQLIAHLREQGVSMYPLALSKDEDDFVVDIDLSSKVQVAPDAPTRAVDTSPISFADNSSAVDLATKTDMSPLPASTPVKQELRVRRKYFQAVAKLGIEAAEALHFAHERGILHRDIKPSNLILDQDIRLMIADFGLAQIDGENKLTYTGAVMGTLRYMSPEQSLSEQMGMDCRTDVYSLGVTLYEMLTLQPIFSGCDHRELLLKRMTDEPVPPRKIDRAIPVDLEMIVLKAISIERDQRYATAQELADDLQRFLKNEPIRAKRNMIARKFIKFFQRQKSLTVLLLVMTILIVLLSSGVVNLQLGKSRQRITPSTTAPSQPSRTITIPAPVNWGYDTSGDGFAPNAPGAISKNWHYMYSAEGKRNGEYRHYPNFSKNHNAYMVGERDDESRLSQKSMHSGKDGQMPIIAWQAPHSGHISVWGFFLDISNDNALTDDGVRWFVDFNTTPTRRGEIASGQIKKGDPRRHFEFLLDVQTGDVLYFGIDPLANANNIATMYGIEIRYKTLGISQNSDYRKLTDSADDFVPRKVGGVNGNWRFLYGLNHNRNGDYIAYTRHNTLLDGYAAIGDSDIAGTVSARIMVPGEAGQMPIAAWTSPIAGIVHLSGLFRDIDLRPPLSDDKIRWFIDLNSTEQDTGELLSGTVSPTDSQVQDIDLYVDVEVGDTIYLGIDPLTNPKQNAMEYNVTIYLVAADKPPN